jgi:hypothetical protein
MHSEMPEFNQDTYIEGQSKSYKQDSKVNIHPRRFVQHDYHDYSTETPLSDKDCATMKGSSRSGICKSGAFAGTKNEGLEYARCFPFKLHRLLLMAETKGYTDIVSWQIHGRSFKIHNAKKFFDEVIPLHFRHNNIKSFYRQLNLYGFLKITQGPDKGAYYHELFLYGMCSLAEKMRPKKVKGTFVKGIANPTNEPNFYTMPFVKVISGYAKASASLQPGGDHSSLEEKVSATNKISYLQQTKDKALLLEDIDLKNVSFVKNDPFDNTVSNDVFFNDEELFTALQELQPPNDLVETIYHEGILDDISLEDGPSNSKQYYSVQEYVDTCALLKMIINQLE